MKGREFALTRNFGEQQLFPGCTVILTWISEAMIIVFQKAMTGESLTINVEPWNWPRDLEDRLCHEFNIDRQDLRLVYGTKKLYKLSSFSDQGVGPNDTVLVMKVNTIETNVYIYHATRAMLHTPTAHAFPMEHANTISDLKDLLERAVGVPRSWLHLRYSSANVNNDNLLLEQFMDEDTDNVVMGLHITEP